MSRIHILMFSSLFIMMLIVIALVDAAHHPLNHQVMIHEHLCLQNKYKEPVLRNTMLYHFRKDEWTDINRVDGQKHLQIQCISRPLRKNAFGNIMNAAIQELDQQQQQQQQLDTSSTTSYCSYSFLWPNQITCESDYVDEITTTTTTTKTKAIDDEGYVDYASFISIFSHWTCYSPDNFVVGTDINLICPFQKNDSLCDIPMATCYVKFSAQSAMTTFMLVCSMSIVFTILFFVALFISWKRMSAATAANHSLIKHHNKTF